MSSTQEVGEIFGEGAGPAQAMLRSPTVLILSVGLWGMNVFFFQLFGINYEYVLNYDLMAERKESTQLQQHQVRGMSNQSMDSNAFNDEEEECQGLNNQSMDSNAFNDEDEEEEYQDPVEEKPASSVTWCKLVLFSSVMLVVLNSWTYYWTDYLGRGSIGAVFSFYGCVMLYICFPIPSNRWLQRSFLVVLQRAFELVHPRCSCITMDPNNGPRPIPFIDVFFADAMCSLSKVFFDWGMLFHMALHFPEPVPPALHNILIPSAFAAVPYLIRARQCLIMHTVGKIKNDPKRYQHLANALKYSTSIFPLCLSAYQKTIDHKRAQELEIYLIFLLTVNGLYALYWDIVMDWGMMQNPSAVVQTACVRGVVVPEGREPTSCHHGLLRPQLRFGLSMSVLILLADSLLRFSWLLRFVTPFPSNDSFVLTTQFLEVFRRAIWNLLRVEWENIKQKSPLSKVHNSFYDKKSTEMTPIIGPKIMEAPRDI